MAPRVPARTAVNLSALKMRIRATKNVAKIVSIHCPLCSTKRLSSPTFPLFVYNILTSLLTYYNTPYNTL